MMVRPSNDTNEMFRITAAFASGGSATSGLGISHWGARGFGLLVPSGTPYCDIGFQVSASGFPDWTTLANAGNTTVKVSGISAEVTARYVVAPAETWAIGALPSMRLVSFSGGAQTLRIMDTGLTFQLVALY